MVEINNELMSDLISTTAEAKEMLQNKSEQLQALISVTQSIIDEIDQLRSDLWDCSIRVNSQLSELKCSVIND